MGYLTFPGVDHQFKSFFGGLAKIQGSFATILVLHYLPLDLTLLHLTFTTYLCAKYTSGVTIPYNHPHTLFDWFSMLIIQIVFSIYI